MKNTAYPLGLKTRFENLSIEWEGIIAVLAVLCGIAAIVLGIVWMFLGNELLLFVLLGLSLCYFIGRDLSAMAEKEISAES